MSYRVCESGKELLSFEQIAQEEFPLIRNVDQYTNHTGFDVLAIYPSGVPGIITQSQRPMVTQIKDRFVDAMQYNVGDGLRISHYSTAVPTSPFNLAGSTDYLKITKPIFKEYIYFIPTTDLYDPRYIQDLGLACILLENGYTSDTVQQALYRLQSIHPLYHQHLNLTVEEVLREFLKQQPYIPMHVVANCHDVNKHQLYIVLNGVVTSIDCLHDLNSREYVIAGYKTYTYATGHAESSEGKCVEIPYDWNEPAVELHLSNNQHPFILGWDEEEVYKVLDDYTRSHGRRATRREVNQEIQEKVDSLNKEHNEQIQARDLENQKLKLEIDRLRMELDTVRNMQQLALNSKDTIISSKEAEINNLKNQLVNVTADRDNALTMIEQFRYEQLSAEEAKKNVTAQPIEQEQNQGYRVLKTREDRIAWKKEMEAKGCTVFI